MGAVRREADGRYDDEWGLKVGGGSDPPVAGGAGGEDQRVVGRLQDGQVGPDAHDT